MAVHEMKIGPDLVPELLDGLKTGTIRYDNERDIRPGDVLRLFDAETGELVASREVEHVSTCRVIDALDVMDAVGGRYSIERTAVLVETLNGYYDDEIGLGTSVDVIVFEPPEEGPSREERHRDLRHTHRGQVDPADAVLAVASILFLLGIIIGVAVMLQ